MKSRIQLTYGVAMAISENAGNSSMHKANRKSWNDADWNAMLKQFKKLIPFLPVTIERDQNDINTNHRRTI